MTAFQVLQLAGIVLAVAAACVSGFSLRIARRLSAQLTHTRRRLSACEMSMLRLGWRISYDERTDGTLLAVNLEHVTSVREVETVQ